MLLLLSGSTAPAGETFVPAYSRKKACLSWVAEHLFAAAGGETVTAVARPRRRSP